MNENKEGWCVGWVLGGIQTGIACAIMVLLRQVLLYLKNGAWVKISVIDGLLQFTRHHPPDWLIYPGDWIGVHKILSQIPLAVGFILLGLVWAIIVGVVWAIRLGLVGWRLEEHSKLKRTKKAEKAGAE
jgi:hypothetical protein